MQNYTEQVLVFSTDDTDKVSAPLSVRNYKCVRFTVVVSGDYDGLVQFVQSDQGGSIDFGVASDEDNQWTGVQVADQGPDASAQTPTGILFPDPDGRTTIVYEANTNGAECMGIQASGASAGDIKVFMKLYDNANA